MTGVTTGQTSLATATDSDDTESYLTTSLVSVLQALANLFESATGHDHTGAGKGKPVGTGGIAGGVVTSAMLAAGAVTQRVTATGTTAGPTTLSTTFVDMAEMTTTFTTSGGDVLVWLSASVSNNAAGGTVLLGISLDGAVEVGIRRFTPSTNGFDATISTFARFPTPAAGSHTIKGRWRVTATTGTLVGVERDLLILEVKA